jgi:hypothetical protein
MEQAIGRPPQVNQVCSQCSAQLYGAVLYGAFATRYALANWVGVRPYCQEQGDCALHRRDDDRQAADRNNDRKCDTARRSAKALPQHVRSVGSLQFGWTDWHQLWLLCFETVLCADNTDSNFLCLRALWLRARILSHSRSKTAWTALL